MKAMTSYFDETVSAKTEISSGDLFSSQNNQIVLSPALDLFSLHDCLLYGYEISNSLNGLSSLRIHGLMPDWAHVFEIIFCGVSKIEIKDYDIHDVFSVNKLIVPSKKNGFVSFEGEFEGQSIEIRFSSASYKRYVLDAPLSRQKMGW
jgi:hypothetical protein